jgi:hypothetical protein
MFTSGHGYFSSLICVQIGKTSAVVLTLSGVLKDILLVVASVAIFRDPVTALQCFGYSIALGGLMYYRLGGEKFQHAITEARLSLAGLRQNHPGRTKAVVLCLMLGNVFLVLFVVWPAVPEQRKKAPFG